MKVKKWILTDDKLSCIMYGRLFRTKKEAIEFMNNLPAKTTKLLHKPIKVEISYDKVRKTNDY